MRSVIAHLFDWTSSPATFVYFPLNEKYRLKG